MSIPHTHTHTLNASQWWGLVRVRESSRSFASLVRPTPIERVDTRRSLEIFVRCISLSLSLSPLFKNYSLCRKAWLGLTLLDGFVLQFIPILHAWWTHCHLLDALHYFFKSLLLPPHRLSSYYTCYFYLLSFSFWLLNYKFELKDRRTRDGLAFIKLLLSRVFFYFYYHFKLWLLLGVVVRRSCLRRKALVIACK